MFFKRKVKRAFAKVKKDILDIQRNMLQIKGDINEIKNLSKINKEDKKITFWLTGLPCSGKTTIAKKIEKILRQKEVQIVNLDGDDVRGKLNQDLGFSKKDRKENLRRIAHVANLLNEKGSHVVASVVSPTNDLRKVVTDIIKSVKMIFIKCSLKECEKRDVKGMYKKARQGEIKGFTGVSAPFEAPINPDLTVDTEKNDLEECTRQILEKFSL